MKPSVFIGSSKAGLDFARTIRGLLSDEAQITLWDEGTFEIGKTNIENLLEKLPKSDFAILVFTPDDKFQDDKFSPRDNVILELGLSVGILGRARTFIVQQATSELKIPSDLLGVSTAIFEWPHDYRRFDDYKAKAALGRACDDIRWRIRQSGPREKNKLAAELESVRDKQEEQEHILRRVVAFSMSGSIYGA